jgi:hypothetical protein
MQWHGAPFLLLMFMVEVQPFVRPRTWSSACSVTASRRKGFKRPKISHICTVLKSSRTHTKNKLIIHPSTVYFLIMHANTNTNPNPNLKHWPIRELWNLEGKGNHVPQQPAHVAILQRGTRVWPDALQRHRWWGVCFRHWRSHGGRRRPATAIGSWVRGARSIARDERGDWLPNTGERL